MEKTKKNGILKTAACIFGGTMLMTCVLGGTLAKYTSEDKTAQATITAATWDVQLNDSPWASAQIGTIAFDDIKSCAEGSTAAKPDKPAPGTWAYEPIKITNNSEVTAKITVTEGTGATDVSGSNLSLKVFEKSDSAPKTKNEITGDLSGLNGVEVAPQSSKTVYVAYVWEFGADGSNATKDTELAGTPINFNSLTLKAEQAEHVAEAGE